MSKFRWNLASRSYQESLDRVSYSERQHLLSRFPLAVADAQLSLMGRLTHF
jgi:hypothetical protein